MGTLGSQQASLAAQRLKRLPPMRETRVRSLGWEDPLEKEMVTHSSILAWRVPWTEDLVGYSPRGRKESDTTERLLFHFLSLSGSQQPDSPVGGEGLLTVAVARAPLLGPRESPYVGPERKPCRTEWNEPCSPRSPGRKGWDSRKRK